MLESRQNFSIVAAFKNEAGIVEEGVFHIIACSEESSELIDFFFDFFELFFSRFQFDDPYALREEIETRAFSLNKKNQVGSQ